MRGLKADFKQTILRRMAEAPSASVWTPSEFLDVAPRQAVDQTLSRLVATQAVERIARGLYRIPQVNILTGDEIGPDIATIVEAIAREKKIPITIDDKHPDAKAGLVIAITTARISPLTVGNFTIEFRKAVRHQRASTTTTRRRAPVRLTGNAGSGYEDMVAVRFLIDLLSGTNTLGTTFGRVATLDWQARDAGWLADDLAVTCDLQNDRTRAVGISIKSNLQVTRSGLPQDFVSLAWRQWLARDTDRAFRRGIDAIALATAKLSAPLKRDWDSLQTEALQTTPSRMAARLANDDGEGAQASATQRAIFRSLEPPTDLPAQGSEQVVELLRDIRLLDFDFASPTSSDKGQAILACQGLLTSGDASEASELWTRLVGIASGKRQAGGSLDLRGLLIELRDAFVLRDHPDFRADWTILNRRSREAMDNIRTSMGDAGELLRSDETATIRSRLAAAGICLLVGESGSGKSALAKQIAMAGYPRIVWLSATNLDYETEIDRDQALGLIHGLAAMLRVAPERCLLVLDGLEAYNDRALRSAARLIKEFASPCVPHVDIVITAQFAAAERKMRQLVQLGVAGAVLQITPVDRPTEQEVRDLLTRFPKLRWVALRPELSSILTNLKILDWFATQLGNRTEADVPAYAGLTGIIDQLWEDWTEGQDDNPARSHLLMNIAAAEGDSLSRGIPQTHIGYTEQSVLRALERADLLRVQDERVSFCHDLLADWARLRALVADDPTVSTASSDRAAAPRWQQAVRLFGQRLLERSPADKERWRCAVTSAADDASPNALLRDLFLDALFLTPNAAELLNQIWDTLASDNGKILNRLLHRFLFVATLPDPNLIALAEGLEDLERFDHVLRVPFFTYWGPVLSVLHQHRDEVARLAPRNGARICALWLRTTPLRLGNGWRTPWRQQAAELALTIANEARSRNIEHNSFGGDQDRVIYDALLYAAPDMPTEIRGLSLELSGRRALSGTVIARLEVAQQKRDAERQRTAADQHPKRRGPFVGLSSGRYRKPWPDGPTRRIEQGFRLSCLEPGPFPSLVKANPDVALEVLLAVTIEEPGRDELIGHSSLPELGLAYWHEGDPPAYFRGPFLSFLQLAPSQGLTFVLKLVNFATRHYCQDRAWREVRSETGTKRWYGDPNVFRWHHDWPLSQAAQVRSSLMALEFWLIEQLDKGTNIEPWLARIMAESESLAFAGVLMDVGKRAPHLFSGVLRSLFFTWEIWDWDFQISTMRQTNQGMIGHWGQQAPQLIARAQQWHKQPHRRAHLLRPDGAIARTMLSRPELTPFFQEVRDAWVASLDQDGEPERLRLMIEQINPANYRFEGSGADTTVVSFAYPEDIAAKNQADLRRLQDQHLIASLSTLCRQWLDGDRSPAAVDADLLWNILQAVDLGTLALPEDADGELFSREDVFCSGIAVLLISSREWLAADPARMAWCRSKLQATVDVPPEPRRFDSELSIGNFRWSAFAAECGVSMLASNPEDRLARQLVAAGIMAFNYHTTALTMTRAASVREKFAPHFNAMISLAIHWAGLRPLAIGPHESALETERAQYVERKAALARSFVDGSIGDIPNPGDVNANTKSEREALHDKRFPGHTRRVRLDGRTGTRETLRAEELGLDSHVMKYAFGWLDVRHTTSPSERSVWVELISRCLSIVLGGLPQAAPQTQKIEGLPNDFDDWVFQLVARVVPRLTANEHSQGLWQSILDRGAVAHQWVERFFWHWFTDGLRAAPDATSFVRIWSSMIRYALGSQAWDSAGAVRYELEDIVVELLCFDQRWNAVVLDDANAPIVAALKDLFEAALHRWGAMPKVINGFAAFAILPGARSLLLPGLQWIADATASFQSYDWKYGLEENVTEYLRIVWQREGRRIATDSDLRRPFLSLLAVLTARGSHAAIALRERVAAAELP